MIVIVGMTKGRVAHSHEFDEKHGEYRHQNDPFHPAILGDDTGEARICERLVGWS